MKRIGKIVLFGVILWIIPFIFGFFFFDKTGNLAIDETYFKSIMVVAGNLTGSFLLYLYLKKVNSNFLNESILISTVWFLINILLDVFILIPMSDMSFGVYLKEIGMRYLVLPVYAIFLGSLLQMKTT